MRAPGSPDPAYWRLHARRYDRAALLLNRRLPLLASRLAEILRGRRRVLELAAGTGLFSEPLARAIPSLVATDRSPEMLDILRGRLASSGARNVEILLVDALHLDWPPGEFDGVVAANLLHLLPDPAAMLAESRRVLVPGGLLAVPTFAHGDNPLARAVSRLLALSGFPIVTRFSGNALPRLVESRGFRVVLRDRIAGILPIHAVVARKE
ncbi:MAG: class I SAM-dependent methyltransferase [Planctomycetes bacterium]|nr:class I SAM-dependent methyltransferase [Planctomycetota bacterium]